MAIKVSLALLILAAALDSSLGADYCNINSCASKSSHTMCLYTSPQPASKCGNLGGQLSASEKTQILNKHNELRQKVASGNEKRGKPGPQPAAKQMPNLEWDDELASVAQRWADQCAYGHDKCRNVERFPVGQNIAISGTTGDIKSINLTDMVESWYNEVADFNRNAVAKFTSGNSNGKQIGHYTQLVWAKTTKVGCGLRNYMNNGFKSKYLVCNYGPAGNYVGQAVYQAR